MREIDVDVSEAGDRRVWRAGLTGNSALAGMAWAVALLAFSLFQRKAMPFAVPLSALMASTFAWSYFHHACRYALSERGLTVVTPLQTLHWSRGDIAELRMRDWRAGRGLQIVVRRHSQRVARRFVVCDSRFGLTPSELRLSLSILEGHFNAAANELLEKGYRDAMRTSRWRRSGRPNGAPVRSARNANGALSPKIIDGQPRPVCLAVSFTIDWA